MNHIESAFVIPDSCREYTFTLQPNQPDAFKLRMIHSVGVSELYPPYEMSRPDYYDNLALCVIKGSARCQTEDAEQVMKPGQLWLFPAGIPYRYWVEDYWEICWVHFDRHDPSHYVTEKRIQTRHDVNFTEWVQFCRNCYWELIRPDASQPAINAIAELIGIQLDRLLKPALSPRDSVIQEQLQDLWRDIDTRPAHPWTLAEMAERLNRSIPQFRRIVERHEQVTPQQKLAGLRLNRASQLLLTTDYTLEHIAELVGYGSPFSLSRAFKRYSGESPELYRRATQDRRTT